MTIPHGKIEGEKLIPYGMYDYTPREVNIAKAIWDATHKSRYDRDAWRPYLPKARLVLANLREYDRAHPPEVTDAMVRAASNTFNTHASAAFYPGHKPNEVMRRAIEAAIKELLK